MKKEVRSFCKKITVPKDCCYIRFNDMHTAPRGTEYSGEVGYTTRGELIIADYNLKDEIIGFELITSKKASKPCQEGKK